jgi:ABC-type branched-subunit amino acid transport system ATPase component
MALTATANGKPAFDSRRVVLRARGLRKAFGGNEVLRGVDLDLHEGEVVLLRGDNGSGKTTLLNILTGNLEPDAGEIILDADGNTEHFRFPRRWWQDLNPFDHFTPERVASEAVGRTWQDVRLFSSQCLADNLAIAARGQLGERPLRALFQRAAMQHVERQNRDDSVAALERYGLQGRTESSADMISLGQTKRVAIARAVKGGARIIFLDEPLSGLDEIGVEDVLVLLRGLVRSHAITLVIVEHVFNIKFLAEMVDSVWTLRSGCLATDGDMSDELEPTPYSAVEFVAALVSRSHERLRLVLPGNATLTIMRDPSASISTPALSLHDVVISRGARRVIGWPVAGGEGIRGLSFTLLAGDIAILEASNGWGKSTLIDAIAGQLPFQGTILADKADIGRTTTMQRSRRIAFVSSRSRMFDGLHVADVCRLAASEMGQVRRWQVPERAISTLSGGEAKRLALATMPDRAIAVYDEPFGALSITALESSLFREMLSGRTTLILMPRLT